jgi:4-aminobutyrate aminotransferase-like enzyme
VKICPPLVITEEAMLDGISALGEAFAEVLVPQAAMA